MEEWDPSINDFVLRCNIAGGQASNMQKLSVPQEKNTIVKNVWASMICVTANPDNNYFSRWLPSASTWLYLCSEEYGFREISVIHLIGQSCIMKVVLD